MIWDLIIKLRIYNLVWKLTGYGKSVESTKFDAYAAYDNIFLTGSGNISKDNVVAVTVAVAFIVGELQ